MTNLEAAQILVDGLSAPPVAVVTMLLSLAAAVDSDPGNAALWREYRTVEATLRGLDGDDVGRDVVRRLSAVGDVEDSVA